MASEVPVMEDVEGGSETHPGGEGVLSPLSGAYLLIVLSEPISEEHKTKIIGKLKQGKNRNRALE